MHIDNMRASEIITKKISFFLPNWFHMSEFFCCCMYSNMSEDGIWAHNSFFPLPLLREIKARKINTCTTDPTTAAFWAFSPASIFHKAYACSASLSNSTHYAFTFFSFTLTTQLLKEKKKEKFTSLLKIRFKIFSFFFSHKKQAKNEEKLTREKVLSI